MDARLVTPYVESTVQIIRQMAGIEVTEISEPTPGSGEVSAYGVTSVITFAGTIKGRLLIDFQPELAIYIMKTLMGEENPVLKDRLMLGCIAEINNIIAGDANTLLNNQYGLGLRLAPPMVVTGGKMTFASSKVESVTVLCRTGYGDFKLNIAFQGGLAS